ncbi:ArsR/SmtB family transcription factor [Halomarina rubra]|uniref:ArsR/SmtB family transcription factor n=1 Tax=Halomarina rubra TaxID=2071873 RepID=A0ABD6AX69_9EURY|nr:winged helix-turn-helix domain-containing protein [Halomarina rubra]
MSLFDVLGSKPRLRIIQELTTEPRYVSELAERVGMDGKSAVHHLNVLEEAGIVDSYRTSRRKYYRLRRTVEFSASPPPSRSFCLYTGDTIEPTETETETLSAN